MSSAYRRALVILLWIGLAGFTWLGLRDAIGDGDESVHAEMLREMLRSGDYFHPRWYGVALAERPLLMYWLAAPFAALIRGELGVRASSALASLGTLAIVYWIALRAWGRTSAGAVAVVLLAGAPSFHDFSRRFMSEAPFVLGLSLALAGAIRAQSQRDGFWYAAAGLGLASAVKSSGVAVAAPALALLPWLAFAARERGDRRTLSGAAALFLGLALPCYLIGCGLELAQSGRERALVQLVQRGLSAVSGDGFAYARELPRSDGPLVIGWLALGTFGACALGRRDRTLAIAGSFGLWLCASVLLLDRRQPQHVLPIYPAAALGVAGCWALAVERFEALRPTSGAALALVLASGVLLISRRYPGAQEYLLERPYGKLLGERALPLAAPDETVYAYEWGGLSLGYYAERRVVLLTAQPERFTSLDFARDALHRAGFAQLVPPLPEPPGAHILIAGDVQDLSRADWIRVEGVLAAAPPYFLVDAEVLSPLESRSAIGSAL